MTQLIKHIRGGQPGNQNARKHGLYSKVLNSREKRYLKVAAGADGLDQEITLLRAKLMSLLMQDGSNIHLLNDTIKTICKIISVKNQIVGNDPDKLVDAFQQVLSQFEIAQPPGPDAPLSSASSASSPSVMIGNSETVDSACETALS